MANLYVGSINIDISRIKKIYYGAFKVCIYSLKKHLYFTIEYSCHGNLFYTDNFGF